MSIYHEINKKSKTLVLHYNTNRYERILYRLIESQIGFLDKGITRNIKNK
jgi:helix-turn-helix protein